MTAPGRPGKLGTSATAVSLGFDAAQGVRGNIRGTDQRQLRQCTKPWPQQARSAGMASIDSCHHPALWHRRREDVITLRYHFPRSYFRAGNGGPNFLVNDLGEPGEFRSVGRTSSQNHVKSPPDGHSGGSSPSNRQAADSPVSSRTCTYRAVVRRSAWPSRCITAFGFSPASISHEACVCRTW